MAVGELSGLLGSKPIHHQEWYDTTTWRVFHAASFAVGGILFIAGTIFLCLPIADELRFGALDSAILYVIGSCGFLSVDLQELITFKECPLRANIALSATGSLLYVIGSIGFLPSVVLYDAYLGVFGFIGGSAVIGVSQTWKVIRLAGLTSIDIRGQEVTTYSWNTLISSKDTFTAAGVEAGAGFGAWCFLVGTIIYSYEPITYLSTVLMLWIIGSCGFTLGAAFLSYRHFVMHVT